MKLLHVLPSFGPSYGGPAFAVVELSRALRLARPDAQVTIASTSAGVDDAWVAHVRERVGGSVSLQLFPSLGSGAFRVSVGLARWIRRHVGDFDLVVVHGVFNPLAVVAASAARSRGVPCVLRPYGTLSPYTLTHRRRWLKRGWLAIVGRRAVERADAVHFTTVRERDKARALGLAGRAVVIPLPNPVPVNDLDDRPVPVVPTILFLSRLDPKKGIELLIDAMPAVRRACPDARLRIAGGGPAAFVADLRARIASAGLNDAVELIGFADRAAKARLFADATAFVLPSRDENFATVVVEAMSAGCPVVISSAVDLCDDVRERDAGIVVDLDSSAIATGLVAALTDAARARRHAVNGVRMVRELYSPADVGAQLAELYERVILATRRSRPSAQ